MIKQNTVVTMHYELKNAQGEVLDSSKDQEPLVYLHGAGNIIVGLEEQLEGKTIGDEVNAVVPPEKGYGLPVDALIQTVPREAFGAEIDKVDVGMRFQAETEQGPVPVVVTAMDDTSVTVDGNHPLAGQELHFNVNVSAVREASAEEIEHGHVHGVGGHQH
ncbi:FKBP-type peptidyl-prolyl cis-trans isomerase [Arenicella xantha]|uniref:Peptidyl-prolyl cis-trans isomerase n=1 Tax=Arenicella xantha TaxID=644221 RepID=A0A395JHK8_9GAMM|nr:peptidylprolyl isomerase [Arenicella xantha]RBP49620.1 FKBP-type peptidyl prolyl cis-trans isomerase /apo-metallochaperone SlyD [Arenicella xantha]